MKKAVPLLLILACVVLCGCSHGRECFLFKRGEYITQISDRSQVSIEYLPGIQTGTSRGARKTAIWKINEIEARFYYDRGDDHVGFTSFTAYDKYANECRIDESSVSEDVYVEWRKKSDGTVLVDYVFFHGEEGTYVFSLSEKASAR